MTRQLALLVLLWLSLCGTGAAQPLEQAIIEEALSQQVAAAEPDNAINTYVANIYQQMSYQLLWEDPVLREQLEQSISDSYLDGLNPVDYPLPPPAPAEQSIDARIHDDIQRSRALVALLSHLYYGKVPPTLTHADWNLGDLRHLEQDKDLVSTSLRDKDIPGLVAWVRPQSELYNRLVEQLANYRELAATGGWPQLSSTRVLQPGMSDPLVGQLRNRLTLSGDYHPIVPATDPILYDDMLADAVKLFQERHLLDADGIVGPGTLAALNITAEQKVNQIRANLERMRWALKGLGGEFLLVDIAGYKLHLIKQHESVWSSPVQVGQPFRETPVFKSAVSYLEWNPTWTVPPTILEQDLLPALKRDPSQLQRRNMVVLSHSGENIDPDTIDWSHYPEQTFPYLIRQTPGPHNALGTVKFIFPNKHLVFLHDTPSKNLFERSNRAFSSGCIRVAKPYELAQLLIESQGELSDNDIQAILASGETQRTHLKTAFPIVLLYWTTKWTDDGKLLFAPDIYSRDAKITAALDNRLMALESNGSAR